MAFLKTIWKSNSKHKKLSEELALQGVIEIEAENHEMENDEVVTFKLKYLGSTVVEKVSSDNATASESVKNILKTNKNGRKNVQRVNMTISLKGIVVTDLEGNDVLKVSIYRISNCSTDSNHRQVFSFVSTDANETMECHAFLCSKRKIAETVTLAIANSFNSAYEVWKISPDMKHDNNSSEDEEKTADVATEKREEHLIVFDDEPLLGISFNFKKENANNFKNDWVCFDDDFTNPFYGQGIKKMDLVTA